MNSSQPLSANLIQSDPRFNALVKDAMNKVKQNKDISKMENTSKKSYESSNHQARTMRSILWKKVLDVFERHELSSIFSFFSMGLISVLIGLSLTYPNESKAIFEKILSLENFIIPKLFLSMAAVFSIPSITTFIREFIENIKFKVELNRVNDLTLSDTQTIEGIPIDELLDHLFEVQTFKRNDIEAKFGIPRNKFTRLAKKLDNLNVLSRGENNSRVLNEEFTRKELFSILEGKTSASEIDDSPTLPVFNSQSISQSMLAT